MNRKVILYSVLLINTFISNKCEDNPSDGRTNLTENINSTDISDEELPQTNDTNSNRKDRQDFISNAISSAVAAVIGAVSSEAINQVTGNQIITTGEYCGLRASNRFCDDHCYRYYDKPITGWCRNGICVCECDQIRCERYCRRHWDNDYEYDHDDYYPRRRYPVARQQYRYRGYCSLRGCRCD